MCVSRALFIHLLLHSPMTHDVSRAGPLAVFDLDVLRANQEVLCAFALRLCGVGVRSKAHQLGSAWVCGKMSTL